MREERGTFKGDMVISEPVTLWGTVAGNVSVIKGGKFYLRGSVYGNISAEPGGRAHLLGNITGDLTVMEDAKVILAGAIGGDAINEGGRLYIEHTAKVMGKVKGRKGKTQRLPNPADKPREETERKTYNLHD